MLLLLIAILSGAAIGPACGTYAVCTVCTTEYATTRGVATGSSVCGDCAAGFGGASVGGLSWCLVCGAGSYKSSVGKTACSTGYTTAAGTATEATAQSQCNTCAAGYGGTTVTSGNSGCTICAAGYYTATASNVVCMACTTGYATTGGVATGSSV